MNNKRIIQIESWNSDEFIEILMEKISEKIKEELDCCNDTSIKTQTWLTTKEACDYYKISRPTLKNMRERGELEYKRVGRSFRYLL